MAQLQGPAQTAVPDLCLLLGIRRAGGQEGLPVAAVGTLGRLNEEEETLTSLQCMRAEAAAWAAQLSELRQQELPASCAWSWLA